MGLRIYTLFQDNHFIFPPPTCYICLCTARTLISQPLTKPSSIEPVSSSDPIRRSIEVEYWVVDSDGRLTEPGELVDAAAGVEREFVEPLLEIKTTPCESSRELRTELLGRIEAVLDQAKRSEKHLVPLATPLNYGEIPDIADERTRIQDRTIGENFEYVRHCAGTHIHTEQQPGKKIDQLNTLIALDPALALVNSSPYFQGRNLAAGARSKMYRWLAYENLDHQGRLWRYVKDHDEWERRLERRYEEFLTSALDAGFDRSTIEANFDPESAVWTPVQLREEFGTVEWRSPDTAFPSEILTLAEDLVAVVDRLCTADVEIGDGPPRFGEEMITLPAFETVCEHVEAAIQHGVSEKVDSYLTEMGIEPDAYSPITRAVEQSESVTIERAREIRLEYAARLEADVKQPISAD